MTADVENKAVTGVDGGRGEGGGEGGGDGGGKGRWRRRPEATAVMVTAAEATAAAVMAEAGTAVVTAALVGRCGLVSGGAGPGTVLTAAEARRWW